MSDQGASRPYFIPESVGWEALPESLRVAIATVVQPVYEECVVQTTDALERSAGASITSCLVMELLDQLEVGGLLGGSDDPKEASQIRERLFSRLLHTTTVKQKLTDGLMRLRNQRLKIATMDPVTARRVFGVRSGRTDEIEAEAEDMEVDSDNEPAEECDE